MEYEVLKHELKVVSKKAATIVGVHGKVCEKSGITQRYGEMIRRGIGAKTDTPENRELLSTMIRNYRKQMKKAVKKLEL